MNDEFKITVVLDDRNVELRIRVSVSMPNSQFHIPIVNMKDMNISRTVSVSLKDSSLNHEVAFCQLAFLSTLIVVVNGILVAAVGETCRQLKASSATIVNVKATLQETVLVVWRMTMTTHQPA